ncbi:MAG TPA: type II secretion system F family protein [Candidatus Xenobia bacterium]|jgi:type IV pilus assembly protein PilC
MLKRGTARRHVAQFYRQLALLYRSGVNLERSLEICARQTSSVGLRAQSRRLAEDLRHGVRMSDAVARIGAPFTPLHAGVILAAETTGWYEQGFEQLATWEEKADSLERQIRSLLTYPILVVTIAAVGTCLLLRFLSPLIADVVKQTGGEASLATRIVLLLGQTIWSWQFCLGISIAAVVLLFVGYRLMRNAWLKRAWERWSMYLPLVGRLLKKAWLIRVARCLNSLMKAGIPLVTCIELAADATGNSYLGEVVLRDAAMGVRKGERLSQALPKKQLSSAFIGMMAVGETSGRLPDMLGRVADLHEIELSNEIEAVLRGIEPFIITVVGGVVLLCLMASLQPLYSMIMRL